MSREEFMKELAYLLQDIPNEEKADAMQYYNDYFEEAGPENEDNVLRELGSPERVASIIRADLNGSLEQGGEFTDKGYQDERFKDPNYQVIKRYDLPEEVPLHRQNKEYNQEYDGRRSWNTEDGERPKPWTNKWLKLALWIGIICMLFPVGSFLGEILGAVAALLVGVFVATITGFIVAVALIAAGCILGITHMASGLFIAGGGVLALGISLLLMPLCGLFYGKFIPFLFKILVGFFKSLFRSRKDGSR